MLRQSAMSSVDRYCSPERQTAILRSVMRFVELAEQALAAGSPVESIAALPAYLRLERVGEQIGEAELDRFAELEREIEAQFQSLAEERQRAADAAH
ncbi:MAG: hypothetical protein U1F11_11965 [Steroidobacteraceae bacterium]